MNGASKILTVSYGTFSCTLEGFDDPFNTMKAIAEYFRDLAAEDRYFGAEPPTPDAAMLHRIAEREIQRRVEAKIQENGVVLRASDTAAPEAVPAPVTAPVTTPVPPVAEAPAAVVAPVAAAPAPAPAAPSLAAPDAQVTESVVEKLSRLRSEVAAQPAAASVATMPTVSFAIPDYLEDEHAEVIEAAPSIPPSAFEDAVEATPAEDALPEAEVIEALAPAMLAEDAPLPEEVEPAGDDALLAALMADRTEDTAPPAEEAAPAASDLPESLMAALADSLAGTEVEEVATSDVTEAETAEGSDALDAIAEAELVDDLAALDGVVAGIAASSEDPAPVAEAVAEDPAPLSADAPDAQEESLEAAFARGPEDTLEAAFERSADEVAALDQTADDEAVAGTAPELRPGAAEKLQRARARVIRIRKADEVVPEAEVAAEAAPVDEAPAPAPAPVTPVRPVRVQREAPVAAAPATPETAAPDAADAAFEATLSDIFAEVAEDSPAPAKATPADAVEEVAEAQSAEGLLSAEDEAELMRELAALRQTDEDGPDAAAAAGASAFVLEQENRKGFDGPSADEALGRLMKQADNEMEGPETKRRQSAIAHLKAAVAATVAERKVTGDKPADTAGVSRLARYRNDLAMVVKSALPGRGGAGEPKDRPAPLVLVSEQRIDKPRGTPAPGPAPTVVASTSAPAQAAPAQAASPVRPRRVSASGLAMQAAEDAVYEDEDADEGDVGNLFGDTKGFSDFVERVGATTLEEILEASAAYLAGVEGRDSFSRPQLMQHVGAVVPAGSLQREDGLRGFGTLLRNGRITKLRRGQFVLAEDSPYLAEAKKIAG